MGDLDLETTSHVDSVALFLLGQRKFQEDQNQKEQPYLLVRPEIPSNIL
jgi:hypothetical protein